MIRRRSRKRLSAGTPGRAVAALLAAFSARVAPAEERARVPRPDGALTIEAEKLVLDRAARRWTGEEATLWTGRLVLHADRLVYDAGSDVADAEGDVVLAQEDLAVAARALRLDLGRERLRLDEGTLFVKRSVDFQALAAADTPHKARLAGSNAFTLHARRLLQVGPKRYEVEEVSLTPCDCRGDTPTWRVEAASGSFEVGDSAWLFWPWLYVWKVPIPIGVPLYVPLTSRRTGLLFPSFAVAGPNGFAVEQPFFLTLGRSLDTTLTGGWLSGRDAQGIRGPMTSAELRWAPAEDAAGSALGQVFFDSRHLAALGARWQARGAHAQRVDGAELFADLALQGDTLLLAQLVPHPMARPDYTDSRLRAELPGQRWAGGVSATYLQDLRPGAAGVARPLFGAEAPAQIQIAPESYVALVGKRAGPATWASWLEAGYYPLTGAPELLAPLVPGPRDAQGRPAVVRGLFEPSIRVPLEWGDALHLIGEAVGRADAFLFSGAGDLNVARLGGYLGAELSTALLRDWGPVRHRIEPVLAWRYAPGFTSALEVPAYSRWDDPFDGNALHQVAAVLETRLDQARGGAVRTLLRAAVGQGYDLARDRFSEGWARLWLGVGPLSLRGEGRVDWGGPTLASLFTKAELQDDRGDAIEVSYDFSRPGQGDRILAAKWELFGTGIVSGEEGVQSLTLSAAAALIAGFSLTASATFADRAFPAYRGTLTWASPCDCLRLSLFVESAVAPGQARRFPLVSPILDWESLGGGTTLRHWGVLR